MSKDKSSFQIQESITNLSNVIDAFQSVRIGNLINPNGVSALIDTARTPKAKNVLNSITNIRTTLDSLLLGPHLLFTSPMLIPAIRVMRDKTKRNELFESPQTWDMLLSKGKALDNFLNANQDFLDLFLTNSYNVKANITRDSIIPLVKTLSDLTEEDKSSFSEFIASTLKSTREIGEERRKTKAILAKYDKPNDTTTDTAKEKVKEVNRKKLASKEAAYENNILANVSKISKPLQTFISQNRDHISNIAGEVVDQVLAREKNLALDPNKINDTNHIINYALQTISSDEKTIDRLLNIVSLPLIKKIMKKEKIVFEDAKELIDKVDDITCSEAYKKNIAERPGRAQKIGDFVANVVLPIVPLEQHEKYELHNACSKILGACLRNPESIKWAKIVNIREHPKEKIRNGLRLLCSLKDPKGESFVQNLTKDKKFMEFASRTSTKAIKPHIPEDLYNMLGLENTETLGSYIRMGDEYVRNNQKTVLVGYDIYKGSSDAIKGIKGFFSKKVGNKKNEESSYYPEYSDEVHAQLNVLKNDGGFCKKIGPVYSKKFQEIMSQINPTDSSSTIEPNQKLAEGLDQLVKLSKEAENSSKKTVFGHLGSYVSASSKALGLFLIGRTNEAKVYRESANQSFHHLFHKKTTDAELDKLKNKSFRLKNDEPKNKDSSWQTKIDNQKILTDQSKPTSSYKS